MCNHYNDIKEEMRAFVKEKAGYSRLCGEFKEISEKTSRRAWCSKIYSLRFFEGKDKLKERGSSGTASLDSERHRTAKYAELDKCLLD